MSIGLSIYNKNGVVSYTEIKKVCKDGVILKGKLSVDLTDKVSSTMMLWEDGVPIKTWKQKIAGALGDTKLKIDFWSYYNNV